ncbi:hypothetical protein LCGC14_1757930 [marine sediment metagenome]|uniref:Uncharacterized protein n=1 Tax=marine sediment metagenome TaxID=412755 RepID=A0A0F9H202_9ZZZZ
MKYCNNCRQLVDPQKNYSTGLLLILLLCCGFIPGIIYYLILVKKCPMCNSSNWGVKPQEMRQPQEVIHPQIPQKEIHFCPQCGSSMSGKFCGECGYEYEFK